MSARPPPPSPIAFVSKPSWLGCVLVAWSEKGVCAILLADDEASAMAELARTFPSAQRVPPDAPPHPWVARVMALIDQVPQGPTHELGFPLDLRGTLFQQTVWMGLQRIAPGHTMSYSELAQSIGQAGAVRAVASACAANVVAVAIPCHRVVRRDGAASGYRWGVARKQALLQRETLR